MTIYVLRAERSDLVGTTGDDKRVPYVSLSLVALEGQIATVFHPTPENARTLADHICEAATKAEELAARAL